MDVDLVLVPTVLLLVGWTLYLLFWRYQVTTQARLQRVESFNKLIEKFGTAKEFTDFIQTEEGKKMIADPTTPPLNPLGKVLRFLQAGILFIMIGGAYRVNALRLEGQTDPNYFHQMMDSEYWGTLALFVGAGFIVIAGVSFILTRYWHLANGLSRK